MNSRSALLLLYVAALLVPAAAIARQSTMRADPAAPNAVVPAAKYESAFADYTPYRDEKLAPWRDINDEAARLGGHIGIFGGAGHAGHPSAKSATKPQASGTLPGISHK